MVREVVYAVFGSSGFLGNAVSETISTSGHRVRRLSWRPSDRSWVMLNDGEHLVAGENELAGLLDGTNVVINCAFDHHRMSANIELTGNIIRAAALAKSSRVVHVSSIAVYEPLRGALVTEQSPVQPRTRYGRIKRETDLEARMVADSTGIELVVVQPSIVYGPGSPAWTLETCRRLSSQSIVLPRRGLGTCNPVYVNDVADAIVHMAVQPEAAGRTVIITGPNTVSWGKFYEAHAAALGIKGHLLLTGITRRSKIEIALLGALSIIYRCLPRSLRSRLHVPYVPTRQELDLFSSDSSFDLQAARDLGFRPAVNFTSGMESTAKWLRSHRETY